MKGDRQGEYLLSQTFQSMKLLDSTFFSLSIPLLLWSSVLQLSRMQIYGESWRLLLIAFIGLQGLSLGLGLEGELIRVEIRLFCQYLRLDQFSQSMMRSLFRLTGNSEVETLLFIGEFSVKRLTRQFSALRFGPMQPAHAPIILVKLFYQIVRAQQVMSEVTSQNSSYLELVSEEEGNARKEEIERVANAFSEFLEVEYHDAIFSDANYIPYEQVEEMGRLERSVDELKQRQAELAFEVKSMTDEKEKIEARIATLGKVQETTKKLVEDEAVAGKRTLLKVERQVQQKTEDEQNIVTVDTAKFKAVIEKKRKSDDVVIENMRKVIRKQEKEIAEWKEKLAQLKEKMENEQRLQGEPLDKRSSESVKRLEHDSKAALQASIAKLKQYIQNNEHYLH